MSLTAALHIEACSCSRAAPATSPPPAAGAHRRRTRERLAPHSPPAPRAHSALPVFPCTPRAVARAAEARGQRYCSRSRAAELGWRLRPRSPAMWIQAAPAGCKLHLRRAGGGRALSSARAWASFPKMNGQAMAAAGHAARAPWRLPARPQQLAPEEGLVGGGARASAGCGRAPKPAGLVEAGRHSGGGGRIDEMQGPHHPLLTSLDWLAWLAGSPGPHGCVCVGGGGCTLARRERGSSCGAADHTAH